MNIFGSVRYNSIGVHLKEQFGERIIKLSLDGGYTCPNRDGSKGIGGCSFCSQDGSGTFTGSIEEQIAIHSHKWPEGKYMAYFQNHTNTYEKPERLRAQWNEALSHEGVMGLAIATRPDCLPLEILELLDEFNKKTFLWVELGLQTSNEKTAEAFNRCYKNAEFEKAMADLKALGIKTVVHLILGLPGETKDDMLASAAYVGSFNPYGIKLHMLHIMKDTRLAESGFDGLLSMEEYVGIVCDILEKLPQDITIHRLTGDAPKETLLAPLWTSNKHAVLNAIQQELKARGSYQGSNVL